MMVFQFVRAHVIPLVIFPSAMDSTKQVTTLSPNKWLTFRKVSQLEQSFQSRRIRLEGNDR